LILEEANVNNVNQNVMQFAGIPFADRKEATKRFEANDNENVCNIQDPMEQSPGRLLTLFIKKSSNTVSIFFFIHNKFSAANGCKTSSTLDERKEKRAVEMWKLKQMNEIVANFDAQSNEVTVKKRGIYAKRQSSFNVKSGKSPIHLRQQIDTQHYMEKRLNICNLCELCIWKKAESY
jgi:hypothetical protein